MPDNSSVWIEACTGYRTRMNESSFTSADLDYIHANYRRLEDVCREHGEDLVEVQRLIQRKRLPAPSYVLPGGVEMVPADYFELVDDAGGPGGLRREFERRYRLAEGDAAELAQDWDGYIGGIYGV